MNRNEERLARLLDGAGIPYEAQGLVAGHHVDFLAQGQHGPVAVDANGVWWHSKPKIIACDEIKLRRLLEANVVPLGIWDWRIVKEPNRVLKAVRHAIRYHAIELWDWKVPLEFAARYAPERSLR